jgi:antitoxin component HigA of HigAB toxin-antitoxin module
MPANSLPGNRDEYRSAIEPMEKLLEETEQDPEELTARARELRKEADATEITAYPRSGAVAGRSL